MTKMTVEIQGTTEIEWTSQVEVEVPQAVIDSDDPDVLSDWAELNLSDDDLDKNKSFLSEKVSRHGADFVR